ncbi:unnamed protein product, partial [Callosobruchus maculatus]
MENHLQSTENNTVSSKYETYLQLLECPVCYNYLTPPVGQCVQGHVVCPTCFDRLDRCPVCRSRKSEAGALFLERKEHEAICEFAPLLCPLRLLDCFWEGDKDDLVDHLKSRHPERIIFSNTENFVCRSVLGGTCLLMVVLFHTEDTLFRAYWQFDRQEALMKFSICQIDRSKKEEEFYYSISLLDIHTEKETLKLTTKCYISNEVQQEKMENTDFVAFEYDILRKATTEFGDVKCKKRCLVKIIFFFFITITTPKKWKLLYRECTQSFRKLNKNFISQKPEF